MTTSARRSQRDNRHSNGRSPSRRPALHRVPVPTGDRVVDRLVRQEALDPDRVTSWVATWQRARSEGAREPLWRFVARQDDVDAGSICRSAAEVYGFDTVKISIPGTVAMARMLTAAWPHDAYARLTALSALPVSTEAHRTHGRLVIGSSDVVSTALRRLADDLVSGPYVLAYVDDDEFSRCEAAIRQHLPHVLPVRTVRWAGSGNPAAATLRKAA